MSIHSDLSYFSLMLMFVTSNKNKLSGVQTLAEMDKKQKNEISMRRQAFEKLKTQMQKTPRRLT
ncbi:MAG: non-canonical purine NTP pyrophosphatase [Candidatus Andersenbacteria bacterium]